MSATGNIVFNFPKKFHNVAIVASSIFERTSTYFQGTSEKLNDTTRAQHGVKYAAYLHEGGSS